MTKVVLEGAQALCLLISNTYTALLRIVSQLN